jgi:tripartite-type tricarboxylate transporter receptor subunit TctC
VTWAYGGSASQLAAALFKSMAKVDMLLVPYKGNVLAVTAVIGGEISLVFGAVAQSAPQVKAGRLRALGVTSLRRSPVMPDVPAIAEAGVPGFEVSTWYGLLAPAATPRAVIERINAELVRILALPEVRERLAAEAFELPSDTPEQFAALIKAELVKWARVVRETGARAD